MNKLDGADLGGSSLRRVTTDCSPYFMGTMCTEWGAEDAAVNLSGADLRGADLSGLPDVIVTGAAVEGATFPASFPTTLLQAQFEQVQLDGTYGAGKAMATFTPAEIAELAPFIERCTGCWAVYVYRFFPGRERSVRPPSFDCDRAGNDAEREICERESLCGLDRMLSAAYSAARGAPGADTKALKRSQTAWLQQRNECGDRADCLHTVMRERIAALAAGEKAPGLHPGTFRRYDHEPVLPETLGDVAGKLAPLLSNNVDVLTVKQASAGTVTVDGEALGANGHTCWVSLEYRFDPSSGRYLPVVDDAEWDYGTLVLVDEYLLFEGGRALCGVRASLDGLWVMEGSDL